MPLREIAECDDKNCGDQFRNGGIKVKMFHQKLEKEIIEKQAEADC